MWAIIILNHPIKYNLIGLTLMKAVAHLFHVWSQLSEHIKKWKGKKINVYRNININVIYVRTFCIYMCVISFVKSVKVALQVMKVVIGHVHGVWAWQNHRCPCQITQPTTALFSSLLQRYSKMERETTYKWSEAVEKTHIY